MAAVKHAIQACALQLKASAQGGGRGRAERATHRVPASGAVHVLYTSCTLAAHLPAPSAAQIDRFRFLAGGALNRAGSYWCLPAQGARNPEPFGCSC